MPPRPNNPAADPRFRVDLSTMAHKRGAPVLIEVLRSKAAVPGPGGARPSPGPAQITSATAEAIRAGVPTLPNAVPNPSAPGAGTPNNRSFASAPPPPSDSSPLAGSSGSVVIFKRRVPVDPRLAMYLIGVAVVVIAVVWFVAFRAGENTADRKWEDRIPAGPDSAQNTPLIPDPLNQGNPPSGPNGASGNNSPGPSPFPPTPPSPKPNDTAKPATPDANPQLVPGLNHLIVGTFRRLSDAQTSAEYLASNGLPVIITAPKGDEPTTKTTEFWVWIAQGFERPNSTSEATKLRTRVIELGRLWKTQNKLAPTDFSQPYWYKLRAKGE
jgi:hypothetical protein